ncbi:MAG TPA: FtsX-like permease family protein [Spirochaetales bacterium]|nr:FtsX-like permease family protein [Spirochaetales bacterium]
MIEFTMALRNTVRQPRRTLLLGGAIAFGVLIICLTTGFTAGMESAVQNNVTLFSGGHILVNGMTASQNGRIQNRVSDEALIQKVKELVPEAISVSPTAQAQATIVFGSREQQLRLRGVDWTSDKLFSQNLILTGGDWKTGTSDRMLILGAQSARRFGLGIGDSVVVRLSTASGQQNVVDYKVGATYDDTAAGGMTTVLVPLTDLLSDLNMKEGEYQALAIFLPDASRADAVANTLKSGLAKAGYTVAGQNAAAAATSSGAGANTPSARSATGSGTGSSMGTSTAAGIGFGNIGTGGQGSFAGTASGLDGVTSGAGNAFMQYRQNATGLKAGASMYRISTVTELSGQMGTVLGSVRWIGGTIFVIMLLLTSAGIANTYRMVLLERTQEIGMLRCVGFRQKDVFKIFMMEAALIAFGGSLAGILVSLPVGLLVHLIPFNPQGSLGSALARGHLVFAPNLLSYCIVCLIVVAVCLLAVSGSARKAARLQPVEAMRKVA